MKVSLLYITVCAAFVSAFEVQHLQHRRPSLLRSSATATPTDEETEQVIQKKKLLGLLGNTGYIEPVLADPITKESLRVVAAPGVLLGGETRSRNIKYDLVSSDNTYRGTSDTFLNLLEAVEVGGRNEGDGSDSSQQNSIVSTVAQRLVPFIPPPLRLPLASAGFPIGDEYVPMRDLFTSPAVSFAYERGWRQNFATAGFPGPDEEAQMAKDYFGPAITKSDQASVLVDMSCATGLFTRRFAKSGDYNRVIGCDYSPSMLQEARRRVRSDPDLSPRRLKTRLDLVRCDVGKIPMKTDSVDALHAGAAMHCWPELELAASEIYRVLKPGGRYFATTFLSSWFRNLQSAEGGTSSPSRQAFQYFSSTDQLRGLMEAGGFAHENISIEVLQPATIVIRCEK